MLWKRKLSITLVWSVVGIAALAIVSQIPAVYRSEALILVDSQKIPEKYVASTVSSDLQDRLATINQQILSSTRLKKIIEDFNLYRAERKALFEEEVLEMMRKDITITLERGWVGNRPGAFRIGYQGEDPAIVSQVANRLTNLYIEENLKTREVQAEGTSEFLDTQLQEAKKRLDELEATVSEYKIKHSGELPQQESSLVGTLSRLQVELEANRDAMNRAQQSRTLMEHALSVAEASLATNSRISDESGATQTSQAGALGPDRGKGKKQSDILEDQLDLALLRFGPEHPEVKRLERGVANFKRLEEKQAQDTSSPQVAGGSPNSQTGAPPLSDLAKADAAELARSRERLAILKTQIQLADKELENREADQRRIVHDIALYQSRVEHLPVREQEMAQITRDYEISKANYKSVLDKKLSAEMATDMEHRQKSERFTVLDPARVPEKPFKPNRPLLSGLGIAVGLVLGLAVGLGKELRQDVLLGEWELPSNITILARLPYIDIPGNSAAAIEAPPSGRKRRFTLLKRLAVLSSVLLSLLGMISAGVYFLSHRF